MKRKYLLLRITLFILMICLGTVIALLADETTGLALNDLSDVPVKTLDGATFEDTLYTTLAGNNRGIYRSDDYGRSWEKVTDGPEVPINTVEVHPTNSDTFFAGTAGGFNPDVGSLWYSNNRGETWQQYTLNLPTNPEGELPAVTALSVDPNHPGVLYVGTAGQGLYRVQSGYAGYQRVGSSLADHLYIKDIVAEPNKPVYAISTEGLLVIEDNTWQQLDTLPDAPLSLAVDPSNPQLLYAGTVGYGIHRSIDGGQTWQAINEGLGWQPGVILRVPAIALDEDKPEHLAIATAFSIGSQLVGDGIYESFDNGEHWTKIADEQEIVEHLTIEAGGIYAATDKGLKRYGNPLPVASPKLWLRTLFNPSEPQILILALTAALAILVLLGRTDWLAKMQRKPIKNK